MRYITQQPSPRPGVIAAFLLTLLVLAAGVPAAAQEEPPSVVGLGFDEASAVLEESGYEVDWEPRDFPADPDVVMVIDQENFPEDRFVRLTLGTLVPDVVGLPGSDVEEIAALHGLAVEAGGELGDDWVVVDQSPSPGELVGFGEVLVVALEPGDGDGVLWPWVVLIVSVGGGGLLLRRWLTRPPADQHSPHDEPDREQGPPNRVWVRTEPGPLSVDVDLPSNQPIGRVVRVELVVGAARHQVEEVDG